MLSYLSKTIAALSHDILAMHDNRAADYAVLSHNDVTEFVFEQIKKMPVFLSWPVLLATAVFGLSRFFRQGTFFYKSPPKKRRLQAESWRHSKFGPSRDLMKFYTSLVVLAFYSRRVKNQVGDG